MIDIISSQKLGARKHLLHSVIFMMETITSYIHIFFIFSIAIDKFKYRLPYKDIFGGVSAMSGQNFVKVNGFSNRPVHVHLSKQYHDFILNLSKFNQKKFLLLRQTCSSTSNGKWKCDIFLPFDMEKLLLFKLLLPELICT